MTLTQITEKGIKDGEIINADINASAAIASSKLAKPIDFADNEKARFGTGTDLEIYHDGSHSYLADTGTGNLNITASTVNINNAANSENIARFIQDGAVELYHDNSKKVETTSGGATITGSLIATSNVEAQNNMHVGDNKKFLAGNANDLQIYHDGSDSFIDDAGTGNLFIRSNHVQINKYTGENMIKCFADGAVVLYFDNSQKLETVTNGVYVYGDLLFGVGTTANLYGGDNDKVILGSGNDLQIYHDGNSKILNANNSCDLRIISNSIELKSQSGDEFFQKCTVDGAVELYYDSSKKFETTSGGAKVTGFLNVTTGIHIPDGGNNDSSITIGAGNDLRLYHDGSNSYIKDAGTGQLRILSNQLLIQNAAGDANQIICTESGSVDLHYNGSKKFETGSGGVGITGECTPSATDTYNLGHPSYRWANVYTSGINFAHTSDASGMTSELFDDYEEGTWTPTLAKAGASGNADSQVTSRFGYYVKSGNLLWISFYWYSANLSFGTGTNNWYIDNLPYGLITLHNSAYQFIPGGYLYQNSHTGVSHQAGYRWQSNSVNGADTISMYGQGYNTNAGGGPYEFSGCGVLRTT